MSATTAKSRPSSVRPRQPHRTLGVLGVLAAVASAWAGALWHDSYLRSIGDPDRGFLLEAAGIEVTTISLLLVSLLALRVLRAPVWLYLPLLAATGHLVLVAARAHSDAMATPRDRFATETMSSGVVDALMPHSWPLLLVIIAAGAVVTRNLLSAARSRVDRPRAGRARRTALAAAVVLASVNGAVTWWGLIYWWYVGDPSDYQTGITAVLTTAAVLVGGGVAARSLGGGRTTDALVVVGVLLQLALAVAAVDGATAPADPDSAGDYLVLFSVESALMMPGSYPIVLVIVVAVVRAVLRGRPHPTPR